MRFNIALLQILPKEMNQKFNLEKGLEACRKAKDLGADLAVFPEMWNIGYAFCPPDKKAEWEKEAIDQKSEFFQAHVRLAKDLEINIAVTYLEKYSPKPKNNGQSTAYSPLVFNNNPLVIKAKEGEGIFLASFDMDKIRDFRKEEQWRLDYRRSFKQ